MNITLDNLPRIAEELAETCTQFYRAFNGQEMLGAGSDYEVREETCETFLVNDARSLKQLQSLFEDVEKSLKSKGEEERITEESPLILFF